MTKVKEMLGSVRFWFCVVFAVAYILGKQDLLLEGVAKGIEMFTAIGIGIRTLDKYLAE